MMCFWRRVFSSMLFSFLAVHGWAGGSGLNVAVVANAASSNSLELGNYYCEQRHVPPQNYLRIAWTGSNVEWSHEAFTNTLLNPLLAMLSIRQLTSQVDYVVLSMDIPYRVIDNGGMLEAGANTTTSAIYYGFKPDFPPAPPFSIPPLPASCSLPPVASNSYAGSEGIFRASAPLTAPTNSLMTFMITSSNLALAKAIVDQGLA